MLNKKIGKNILSNLSKMPPWPFSKFEKSLIFWCLLKNENKISPKKKEIEIKIENKSSYSKKIINKKIKKLEIKVPDHVLFGLILGTIRGPLKNLPEKKANVSFVNERQIIKKNKYLSWTKILKLKYKIKNTVKEKKKFL